MNAIRVIFPYQREGVWMFDDAAVGLVQEPFVCGIPSMLEELVAGIEGAQEGFALFFSDQPFPGYRLKVDRSEPEAGGTWYKLSMDGKEIDGWLCPALFRYFAEAPATIYARAESRK